MTIPEFIARIEELDRKATKGPWEHQVFTVPPDDFKCHNLVLSRNESGAIDMDQWGWLSDDCEFASASRTLLPLCCRLLKIYVDAIDEVEAEDHLDCGMVRQAIDLELSAAMEVKDGS